jgi:carbonic anhydrase/acetyltransferase-like protein (isoleucine patch superfamily)
VYKNNVQIILSRRLAVLTCLLDEAGGNPVEKKNIYRFMLEHPQCGARVFIDQHASVSGSVVTPGTVVPSGTLWRGNPAREARALSETEISYQTYGARHYVKLKDLYLERI